MPSTTSSPPATAARRAPSSTCTPTKVIPCSPGRMSPGPISCWSGSQPLGSRGRASCSARSTWGRPLPGTCCPRPGTGSPRTSRRAIRSPSSNRTGRWWTATPLPTTCGTTSGSSTPVLRPRCGCAMISPPRCSSRRVVPPGNPLAPHLRAGTLHRGLPRG